MHEALRRPARSVLRPLSFAFAGFYLVLTGYWFARLAPDFPTLPWAWASAGFLLFVVGVAASRIPASRHGMVLGLVAVATVLANVNLVASAVVPGLASTVALVLLAWGVFLTSRGWLAAVVALAFAGWLTVSLRAGLEGEWRAQTFLVLAAGLVAMVAQHVHVRSIRDAEALRLSQEQQAIQQATVERLRSEAHFRAQFLNLVAHELSTPMTAIVLDSRRLEGGATHRLFRNVERLNEILQDVVAITQVAGATLHPRPTDVAAVAAAHTKESFDVEASSPQVILVDPHWLEHTVARLASVCAALMRAETRGRLHVDTSGAQATITWTFEPDGDLAQALDQFQPLSPSAEGRGAVRLRIEAAREAAHAMRGELTVASDDGQVVVRMVLPRDG